MPTVGLTETVTVVLDGSGNGTAKVGPLSARETWTPATVQVYTATNTLEAECAIYAGDSVRSATFRGATLNGSTGDSATLAEKIHVGAQVFAVWSGGDAGTVATLVVTGTKDV